jgi:hypothetical protein
MLGGGGGLTANEYICAVHNGAQINFGDLIPHLTYDAQLKVTFFSSPKAAILTLKRLQKTRMTVKIVFE